MAVKQYTIYFVVELKKNLDEKLYGQHIAKGVIVNALKNHWTGNHIEKPLTLSFHGSPGTGKNYVTKFIQEALYTKGSQSKFVHHFMGRIHFPLKEEVHQYQVCDMIYTIGKNLPNYDFLERYL